MQKNKHYYAVWVQSIKMSIIGVENFAKFTEVVLHDGLRKILG